MAKQKPIRVALPRGVSAFVYLTAPDTEAPEGASFKPDGKFKITVVYDDPSVLDETLAVMRAALSERFPGVAEENFQVPIKIHDDEDRSESFRGKATVKASSKFPPRKVVDAKRNDIDPALVRAGDICVAVGTLYLYEKTEKVRGPKGKLEDVTVQGCSLQMDGVQLIEKRSGGGDDLGFEEEEGYEASETYIAPASGGTSQTPPVLNDTPDNDGDF